MNALDQLAADRTLAVVRGTHIPDPLRLGQALAEGGIRHIELTLTTPDALAHLRALQAVDGLSVGMGTVLSREQAEAAIDAGAAFIVTPAIRPEVAQAAQEAGVPVILGALTPSEILTAHDLGADFVKIFPARSLGSRYIREIRGPLPHIRLLAAGGISAENAAEFLAAGVNVVSAGSSVVLASAFEQGDWPEITRRAQKFVAATYSTEGS